MFEAHGTYPWKDWNDIWTYHTKFIPAGAAKLLIEQTIRCAGPAGKYDQLVDDHLTTKDGRAIGYINSVENFTSCGFLNKAFRVVRSYMDGDVAKVVAVYNHDGVYHLIEADEEAFLKIWVERNRKLITPAYPNEYHLESMRGS